MIMNIIWVIQSNQEEWKRQCVWYIRKTG